MKKLQQHNQLKLLKKRLKFGNRNLKNLMMFIMHVKRN